MSLGVSRWLLVVFGVCRCVLAAFVCCVGYCFAFVRLCWRIVCVVWMYRGVGLFNGTRARTCAALATVDSWWGTDGGADTFQNTRGPVLPNKGYVCFRV